MPRVLISLVSASALAARRHGATATQSKSALSWNGEQLVTRQPRFAWLVTFGVVFLLFVARIVYHLQALDYHAKWTSGLAIISVATILVLVTTLVLLIVQRGKPALLLGIQAVAVLAPYLVIGQGWALAGTVLCASILLAVPGRASWVLFAVVAIGDAGLAGYLDPSAMMFTYAVFVNVANGFAIFAIVRLAQVVQQTHDDGRRLADAEVEAERWRATDRLSVDVGTQLSALIRQTREALTSPTLSQHRLTVIGGRAHQAATDARTIANIHRNLSRNSPAPARQPPVGVGLRFARTAHLLIVADFLATSVLNMFSDGRVPDHLIVGIVVVLAAAALQLYLGSPRVGGAAVRWWPIALAAQVSLLVGATLLAFPAGAISIFLVLAGGTALIRMRAPWSWAALAASAVACFAYMQHYEGIWGGSYMAIGVPYWAAIIYALHKLPEVTDRLHATRDELTRVAIITERLRFARDIHDLLGFHLSAIRLKIELAARSMDASPAEARGHLAQVLSSAEQALTEVRTITTALDKVTCRDELSAARVILEAAGVTGITTRHEAGTVPRSVDNLMGIIVREASTNIIRHARAETCTFDVTRVNGNVAVRITNDGAERPDPQSDHCPAAGLANLRSRVEALGGRLTAVANGDTFTVSAQLPLERAAALPMTPLGGAKCTTNNAAVTGRAEGQVPTYVEHSPSIAI